jgi:hypothetical protein
MFGRLVAPKDCEMIAYAQLEVLGFLPTLQVRVQPRRGPAPAAPLLDPHRTGCGADDEHWAPVARVPAAARPPWLLPALAQPLARLARLS